MKDESDIIVEGTCINAIIYHNVEHNQYGYEMAMEPPDVCFIFRQRGFLCLYYRSVYNNVFIY